MDMVKNGHGGHGQGGHGQGGHGDGGHGQKLKVFFFYPRKAVLRGCFWTKRIFPAKRTTFAYSMPSLF